MEGDQTDYLANEARIRGKGRIDLRSDPPPDLAIAAVYHHAAAAAVGVYRRIRVPEVRIGDEAEVVILVLEPNGKYSASAISAAFPFLTAGGIHEGIFRPHVGSDTDWIQLRRRRVRRVLGPRVRRQRPENGGE